MTVEQAIEVTVDLIKEVSERMKNWSEDTRNISQKRLLEHHINLEKLRLNQEKTRE